MTGYRSPLAPYAASMRDPDPAAARRAARTAYHETGLVLINPDWLAGWADRQQLIILADKVHGTRPKGPG
jgi:hypothetical protein